MKLMLEILKLLTTTELFKSFNSNLITVITIFIGDGKIAQQICKNLGTICGANAFNSDPHILISSDHCIKSTETTERERFTLSLFNVREKQQ